MPSIVGKENKTIGQGSVHGSTPLASLTVACPQQEGIVSKPPVDTLRQLLTAPALLSKLKYVPASESISDAASPGGQFPVADLYTGVPPGELRRMWQIGSAAFILPGLEEAIRQDFGGASGQGIALRGITVSIGDAVTLSDGVVVKDICSVFMDGTELLTGSTRVAAWEEEIPDRVAQWLFQGVKELREKAPSDSVDLLFPGILVYNTSVLQAPFRGNAYDVRIPDDRKGDALLALYLTDYLRPCRPEHHHETSK